MAREKQTSPVVIKIPKGAEKQAANLKLYLVDKQGNVIESQSLKNGEVRLKTSADSIEGKTRVYIAPELPSELSQVTINENALKNMGAWQPSFRLPPTHVFQIPYFPPFPWPLPFGWCNVYRVRLPKLSTLTEYLRCYLFAMQGFIFVKYSGFFL